MKTIFLILFILLSIVFITLSVQSGERRLPSELSPYGGKLFTGLKDPEFINYDLALRNYLTQRIHKRFEIELDPKAYSGFDLLEIEALIKCKKLGEPIDIILKMFPKTQ